MHLIPKTLKEVTVVTSNQTKIKKEKIRHTLNHIYIMTKYTIVLKIKHIHGIFLNLTEATFAHLFLAKPEKTLKKCCP